MRNDTVFRFRKKDKVIGEVLTGIGPVTVQVPKVRDRSAASACFRSGRVPRYVRRARSVEAVLPWLYLKG